MRLVTSSDLIYKGANVGLAYIGSAPDLGCFESAVTTGATTTVDTNSLITGIYAILPNRGH